MAASAAVPSRRHFVPVGAGFTLVEMLVAVAILVILVVALFEVTAGVGNIWKSSGGRISSFQGARAAFSTLNETLARATLNTYSDYFDVSTNSFRTTGNATTFVPTRFDRASELHFLCGPTVDLPTASQAGTGTDAFSNPGDTVFFQAPLGYTLHPTTYTGLSRALNSVGFYIQYGQTDPGLLPPWMTGNNVAGTKNYRFQLVEYVEPTENLQIYTSTANPTYTLDWMKFAGTPQMRVLAENIVLLLLRPRLSPADEAKLAPDIGGTYNESTDLGSVLSPNYHYDSRSWQTGYPTAGRVNDPSKVQKRLDAMKNQLPPIVDVAMVAVDPISLARYDLTTASPPAALRIPGTLFKNSANMETDLTTYATQLSSARIRFHIQRATVGIQAAKWSNN